MSSEEVLNMNKDEFFDLIWGTKLAYLEDDYKDLEVEIGEDDALDWVKDRYIKQVICASSSGRPA